MAVNAAPARAKVAGNVVATPGPGLAWKTPRRSGRSTMAWPAIVSTTDPALTSAVSIRPVQDAGAQGEGGRRTLPRRAARRPGRGAAARRGAGALGPCSPGAAGGAGVSAVGARAHRA